MAKSKLFPKTASFFRVVSLIISCSFFGIFFILAFITPIRETINPNYSPISELDTCRIILGAALIFGAIYCYLKKREIR